MHCFSFDIETVPDVEFGRRMWDLDGLSDNDVGAVMMFKQQQMFRVRVGPIKDLKSADQMLGQIIGAGYTDARLIVDR